MSTRELLKMSRKSETELDRHIREVEKAYIARMDRVKGCIRSGQKQPKDDPHALSRRGVEGQKRAGLAPIHERRRKCAAKRRDGKPCNAPALAGATNCRNHGGYRQNPGHPGSIKRLLNGKLHRIKAQRAAFEVWKHATLEERTIVVRAEIPDTTKTGLMINRANGIKALRAAPRDNGEAWRVWNATQRKPDDYDNPKYEAHRRFAEQSRKPYIND